MPTSVAAFLAYEIIAGVTIGAVLATVAFNFVVQAVFAKKPSSTSPFSQFGRDRMLTVRQPASPTEVVVGEVRKGGVLGFMHTTTVTSVDTVVMTEGVTVPEVAPYTVTVANADAHVNARSVVLRVYNTALERYVNQRLTEKVGLGSLADGEFRVNDATGVYTFNAAQAGQSGIITMDIRTGTTVSKWLHLIIELAGHEVEEIGDIYFGPELVPLDSNGEATGRLEGHVYVSKHLGTDDQEADAVLRQMAPDKWTSAHRLRGQAYVYVRILRNPELFPDGPPVGNITLMVKGYKPYDPRTAASAWTPNVPLVTAGYLTNTRFGLKHVYANEIDDTLLTAAANIADEEVLLSTSQATATFTADASLDSISLAADARLLQTGDGVRVASSGTLPGNLSAATTYYARRQANETFSLHTSLAGAYANTGAVNISSAGSGTHTLTYRSEPRYRANGVFPTSDLPKDILGRLKVAMVGHCVRIGGKWRIRAGAYITPTLAFDDGDARGEFTVETRLSRREAYNGVKGVYSSPDNAWQLADFPSVQVAAYVTEDDDEEIWLDLALPFTSSAAAAQRIGKALLEQARRQITVPYPMKLTGYRAEPPETIQLSDTTMGWTDKVFEIASSTLALDKDAEGMPVLAVDHVLRETDSSVWSWDPNNEERVTVRAPATNLPNPFDVAPPGKPLIIEEQYETREGRGVAVKAKVSWAAAPDGQARTYDFEWRREVDTLWNKQPGIVGLETEALDLAAGIHLFRVLSRSAVGVPSTWAQTRQDIIGLGDVPEEPQDVTMQIAGGLAIVSLTQHAALDVRRGGRILARHCEDTAAPTWETSFSIGESDGYPGDSTLIVLPLKAGTYLFKARDAIGIESADFSQVITKQASVLTFSPLDDLQEDDTFPGTHDNTVVDEGRLKLVGTGLVDDIPDFDAISNLDSFGGIAAAGTYTFAAGFDFGTVTRARLTGQTTGFSENVNDLIDERSDSIDDWLDFDGSGGGGSTDAFLEARETDDDPAGTPTWSAWKRLDTSEYECRGMEFRLRVISYDPAYNQQIETLRVAAEEL